MDAGIYWPTFFFLLFASIACAFGLAVVIASNVVHMAFYLVLSLAATAGLFFLAGADFVGAMQIMIYVGGTLVLLVFGVMLTSQSPFVTMRTQAGEWIMAAILGGALLSLLAWAAFSVDAWQPLDRQQAEAVAVRPSATRIGMGLLGAQTDQLAYHATPADSDHPPSGVAGMSGYLLPFEIVSIHLLVVLVGAAYLARTRRRRDAGNG